MEVYNIGSVKISEDVISTIAITATIETEGVDKISPKAVVNPKNIIGSLKPVKAVTFLTTSEGVEFTIQLSVKHGYKIPEVADRVQTNISDAIQSMTGLTVSKVNVVVTGIVKEK